MILVRFSSSSNQYIPPIEIFGIIGGIGSLFIVVLVMYWCYTRWRSRNHRKQEELSLTRQGENIQHLTTRAWPPSHVPQPQHASTHSADRYAISARSRALATKTPTSRARIISPSTSPIQCRLQARPQTPLNLEHAASPVTSPRVTRTVRSNTATSSRSPILDVFPNFSDRYTGRFEEIPTSDLSYKADPSYMNPYNTTPRPSSHAAIEHSSATLNPQGLWNNRNPNPKSPSYSDDGPAYSLSIYPPTPQLSIAFPHETLQLPATDASDSAISQASELSFARQIGQQSDLRQWAVLLESTEGSAGDVSVDGYRDGRRGSGEEALAPEPLRIVKEKGALGLSPIWGSEAMRKGVGWL